MDSTSGVCCVVDSSSILLVLGAVVSEISTSVVVLFVPVSTLIIPVRISAVVVYWSVRGLLLVVDPASVAPSPLFSPVWSKNIK